MNSYIDQVGKKKWPLIERMSYIKSILRNKTRPGSEALSCNLGQNMHAIKRPEKYHSGRYLSEAASGWKACLIMHSSVTMTIHLATTDFFFSRRMENQTWTGEILNLIEGNGEKK